MSKRNIHGWKTRTADGRKREVRAQLFGSKWSVSSREAGEDGWTTHDPPLLDDLKELESLLSNKYQRKHLAWEHLVSVRELIKARPDPRPAP